MADTLNASQHGLELVDQARRKKGWTKFVTAEWWVTANTSQATLKRFWKSARIDRQAFIGICEAVGVDYKRVVDLEEELPKSPPPEPLYIEQPLIASRCLETLEQPGSLLRIKALRQMGKTLLLNRILTQVKQQECRVVSLSLKLAARRLFTDLDKFLQWFCRIVSRELNLSCMLDQYWEEEFGSKTNCTTYFEEYLLPADRSPLVLALDDVDLVFPYQEISEDFFGLLRFWHERAKSRHQWKQLRLVVAYSTEVYIPLNINQSPFNVGVRVEVPEFSLKQTEQFARLHQLNLTSEQSQQLIQMVGGHPHLLEMAFTHLKNYSYTTLSQLLELAPTNAGIYSIHLLEYLVELKQEPTLLEAFYKVIKSTKPVQIEPIQAYKLNRMGLIQLLDNDRAKPRCQLYRKYFSTYLDDRNS